MSRRTLLFAGLILVIFSACGITAFLAGRGPSLRVVLPSAANLVEGSPVWIDGFQVGRVTSLEPNDGKAVANVTITDGTRPITAGTTARVDWKSLLGERVVELLPGPPSNPVLPDGALVQAQSAQVEIDDLLSALDPKTRTALASLTKELRSTLAGSEGDLNMTLRTAGPGVQMLGQVLAAVGRDGPAIHDLVTKLHEMATPLVDQQQRLRATIGNLTQVTGAVATQQKQLGEGLRELPRTLASAQQTLDQIKPATDQATPLMIDLAPAAARLPRVAENLSPTLAKLRPMLADLRPTVESAQELLGRTPDLLDSSNATLPPLTETVHSLSPAVAFLRPYAPELMGWLSNWDSSFGNFDSRGHFFYGLVPAATSAWNDLPKGVTPPGVKVVSRPAPGSAESQPWTDATGSEMR